MAAGAAELYTGQLQRIPALSAPGAQQLAADLEYFCNVLAALSVALPADLVTWQARGVTAGECCRSALCRECRACA